MSASNQNNAAGPDARRRDGAGKPAGAAPFLHAPEASRSIFTVLFAAASVPLAAGVFYFGWRALMVAVLSVVGAVATESAYYRVTRTPALLGRRHAAVTGLLLALTLPASVPWYVPLTGAVFAIIIGKALFGGMGHFLWQPALVGRLAVAIIFTPPFFHANMLSPPALPVLAQNRVIMGDIRRARSADDYRQWRGSRAPPKADALNLPRPRRQLRSLTNQAGRQTGDIVGTLRRMPPARDLIFGAYGGGIGETCAMAIIIAGLYLVYRNYVRGHLPGMFILSAAAVAAIAPVRAADGLSWQWLPILSDGFDVGFTYVAYHLVCGELLLAGWFLATEMTSRPVTAPAQAIFGLLCGGGAMLLRLYTGLATPAYAAVLLGNTLTPLLDTVIRPRVFGSRRWFRR